MHLIAIGGPAGVGKTTLAETVSQSLGIPHVDFDEASREVVAKGRLSHPTTPEEELLTLLRADRYQALAQAVASAREFPSTVVIASAPFTRHSQEVTLWHSWLEQCGSMSRIDFVWLDLDPETRRHRMIQRGASRDFALVDSGDPLPPPLLPVFPYVHIDASAPLEHQQVRVTALLM